MGIGVGVGEMSIIGAGEGTSTRGFLLGDEDALGTIFDGVTEAPIVGMALDEAVEVGVGEGWEQPKSRSEKIRRIKAEFRCMDK